LDNARFEGEVCFPSGSGLTLGKRKEIDVRNVVKFIAVLLVGFVIAGCGSRKSNGSSGFSPHDFACSGSTGFVKDSVNAVNNSGKVLTNIRGAFTVTGIPRFNPEPEVSHDVPMSWERWGIGETKAIEFGGFASARMHNIRLRFKCDQGAVDFNYTP
jgi:hypothetical protein